jgi:hypothetical protein
MRSFRARVWIHQAIGTREGGGRRQCRSRDHRLPRKQAFVSQRENGGREIWRMLVAGQAELVDEGAGGWAGELVDVGSRVGAWRRLGNGTLDLVLVGVPRAVTGPLLPTVLAEGSPETTGIPQCWQRVAPRLLACLHPMAEEAEHSATGRTR